MPGMSKAKNKPAYAKWSDLSPAEKAAQAARMSRRQGTTPQAYVKGKAMTAADKQMMREATKGKTNASQKRKK